jgi:hypothetical protein
MPAVAEDIDHSHKNSHKNSLTTALPIYRMAPIIPGDTAHSPNCWRRF